MLRLPFDEFLIELHKWIRDPNLVANLIERYRRDRDVDWTHYVGAANVEGDGGLAVYKHRDDFFMAKIDGNVLNKIGVEPPDVRGQRIPDRKGLGVPSISMISVEFSTQADQEELVLPMNQPRAINVKLLSGLQYSGEFRLEIVDRIFFSELTYGLTEQLDFSPGQTYDLTFEVESPVVQQTRDIYGVEGCVATFFTLVCGEEDRTQRLSSTVGIFYPYRFDRR